VPLKEREEQLNLMLTFKGVQGIISDTLVIAVSVYERVDFKMNNEEKILQLLSGMQTDMQGMRTDIQDIRADIQDIRADIQEMRTDIQEIQVEQHGMKAEMQDFQAVQEQMVAEQIRTNQRLDSFEADMTEVKQTALRTAIIVETEVQTNIKLLAEGHSGIVERLERIEDQTSEIDDIKHAVAVLKLISAKDQ